ncbi:MAG: hypothetical protein WBM09_01405 [Gallionella sp.]
MQKRKPIFTFTPQRTPGGYVTCIEIDGQPIHNIKNLDAFYKEFGYTENIRKAGVLPDEFIWDEYTKGDHSIYSDCLQVHIIEYLTKNCAPFITEYGDQYQNWFDDHIEWVTEKETFCVTCRARRFCRIGMSSLEMPKSPDTWSISITKDDQ